MPKYNKSGWYKESVRHSLAAQGIPSGRYYSRKNPSKPKGPAFTPRGTKTLLNLTGSGNVEKDAKQVRVNIGGSESIKKASELQSKIDDIQNRSPYGMEAEDQAELKKLRSELYELQGVQQNTMPAYTALTDSQILTPGEMKNLSLDERKALAAKRRAMAMSGNLDALPKTVANRLPTSGPGPGRGFGKTPIVSDQRERAIERASKQLDTLSKSPGPSEMKTIPKYVEENIEKRKEMQEVRDRKRALEEKRKLKESGEYDDDDREYESGKNEALF